MNRRNRIRRALAPYFALRLPLLLGFLGTVIAVYGALVAFNLPLQGLLRNALRAGRRVMRPFAEISDPELAVHWLGAGFLLLGLYLVFWSGRRIINNVIETFDPSSSKAGGGRGKVDTYMRRQRLANGPRIVAIGGGTGLSTLLRGLKQHSSNITAIVAVTDDGGSSGKLRVDKNMIPPGDIRNCLVALAEAETSMTDLFQHRFRGDSGGLSGHSIGNLLIAALVDQAQGDFERAIAIASDVLAIRGEVMPATLAHVDLMAEFEDGRVLVGETTIAKAGGKIKRIGLTNDQIEAYGPALEAIAQADLIVMGPGSVFTSVIPPLLVPDLAAAIAHSGALKVYVCNVMTQPGESDEMTASEHVDAILRNVPMKPFDHALINTGVPSEESMARYQEVGQEWVVDDTDRVRRLGVRPIPGNYISDTDVVRHDPAKIVAKLMSLLGL